MEHCHLKLTAAVAIRFLRLYIGQQPRKPIKALSIVVEEGIPATSPQDVFLNILAGQGSLQQLSVLSLVDASGEKGEAPLLDLLAAAPSKGAKVSS